MPIPTYDQFIDLQRVGGTGDAGIDGVISLDRLGLDFDNPPKPCAKADTKSKGNPVHVWRVRFADRWLYVYLVLEFQSTVDIYMAVRVMAYVGLLYQDLVRTKQIPDTGKLPPVLPIVLYNGEPRWHAATDVFDLIANIPGSLAKHSPRPDSGSELK